jgi:hypothetical protein
MKEISTRIDINKLKEQLGRLRLACAAAIQLGDHHAVAHLTCEAARLRNCLEVATIESPLA